MGHFCHNWVVLFSQDDKDDEVKTTRKGMVIAKSIVGNLSKIIFTIKKFAFELSLSCGKGLPILKANVTALFMKCSYTHPLICQMNAM
jgi:hypothetical protein